MDFFLLYFDVLVTVKIISLLSLDVTDSACYTFDGPVKDCIQFCSSLLFLS